MGIEQEQCQMYYETDNRVFQTEIECDEKAKAKAYEMTHGFGALDVPFTRMQFGCELEKD